MQNSCHDTPEPRLMKATKWLFYRLTRTNSRCTDCLLRCRNGDAARGPRRRRHGRTLSAPVSVTLTTLHFSAIKETFPSAPATRPGGTATPGRTIHGNHAGGGAVRSHPSRPDAGHRPAVLHLRLRHLAQRAADHLRQVGVRSRRRERVPGADGVLPVVFLPGAAVVLGAAPHRHEEGH